MKIVVRPAEPLDARSIAEVHVQAFRESYGHLVPAENWDRITVDQRERRWNEILPFPWANIWLAVDDNKVVGFAGSSENREADVPVDRQIQALHVLSDYYGTGVAQQLFDAVLQPDESASLWIAQGTPRARAFYARNGFQPDGHFKTGPVAGADILQQRLVRARKPELQDAAGAEQGAE